LNHRLHKVGYQNTLEVFQHGLKEFALSRLAINVRHFFHVRKDPHKSFPSGIAAANLLGFTTQTARQNEVSTSALSLPRKLVGTDTLIHTRRPEAWTGLSESDAALLDLLRRAGRTSELSPEETIRRTITLFSEKGRFARMLRVAASEPPRVRAMIGAIGQQLGKNHAALRRLRDSLNPFSRFDFGLLAALQHARDWQAR
jgi:hypothetical protein